MTEGILLVNKPRKKTSFSLVHATRKKLGVKKVGHAGTLDPFATGLIILLVGKKFTKLSDTFMHQEKEYVATAHLGLQTDTLDCDGQVVATSSMCPSFNEVEIAINQFQGELSQIPPMFSAKKVGGKKLYELARKGKTIERAPQTIHVSTTLLNYSYPYLQFHVRCSKGTYVRTLAADMGAFLGCGAHLSSLERTVSGSFSLEDALPGEWLWDSTKQIHSFVDARLLHKGA